MRRAPVLLPPAPRAPRPLPGWLVVVALVGLALLFCSTVPAVLRHVRLSRDLGHLSRVVRMQEREVRRLELGLEAARKDSFAYEQALRRLIHPPALSATAAAPPVPGARPGARPGRR